MKTIFRLRTFYTDGSEEINGFFKNKENADSNLEMIMMLHSFGDKTFKSGNITQMEVSDSTQKINEDGVEWLII